MNEYRNRVTGELITETELRARFPNVALPHVLDQFTLEAYGYEAVLQSPQPEIDITQTVLRDGVRRDSLGNWVQAWRVERLPPDVIAAAVASAEKAQRDQAKIERAQAVERITVVVDGMTFDGDEVSQGRIARAILAMETAGVASTPWTLSNNVIASVTSAQLRNALVQAGLAQTAMWAI